jgi:phosphopantetheinyl transferase
MPLVYQQNINDTTKMGVWHIKEEESFFLASVPLQKEITHPHKRLQHLAGRHLLKDLFPDFPVELIKIADTRKPFLENEAFHFSISHCGDYAAAMVSKTHRVGVDIEEIKEKIKRIIPKFLTDEECFLLPCGSIEKTATLFWSIKESIYKWQGEGGTDFRKHILINEYIETETNGRINCLFKNEIPLLLHYLFMDNHALTWVLTKH